jgi:acyl-CoA synthetase (AMP-forming)/AMP-acid ligase II
MTSYFLQTRLQSSFPEIFREARELGLSTSFDPNSDPSHTWGDNIREVFSYTDLLFLNETEALHLTRARNARAALKALSKEVSCAVIKLGARGALAVKDGEITAASGFKVLPREVEEVLFLHPKVQEAVVAGVPDAYRGETVKAFVVPKAGSDLTADELTTFCKLHLASFKVPKQIEFRTDLPKTNVGKILRRELRDEKKAAAA